MDDLRQRLDEYTLKEILERGSTAFSRPTQIQEQEELPDTEEPGDEDKPQTTKLDDEDDL
jgi:hypothetical protein